MKEFVYIIESPSDEDLYYHRYESDLLRQAVELSNMKCIVRIVASKETFEKAISEGLKEAVIANFPQDPILHISAHGCEDGICLTNKDFVTWRELQSLLLPISRAREWGLLLCMSACQGIQAIKMAFTDVETHEAAYAVVGCSSKPTWSDTAVAYASFYHMLVKRDDLVYAVDAMKAASGNNDFELILPYVAKNEKLFPPKK